MSRLKLRVTVVAKLVSQRQEASVDARVALREATREAHERIRHHALFRKLLSEKPELIHYRDALARLFGFHAPLEQALRAASHLGAFAIDLERCRRADRLADDLRFLGADAGEIGRLPRLSIAPPVGPGPFLGALYVREGSMQGGRWIAQKTAPLFNSDEGRSFFLGVAEDQEIWDDCCRAINAAGDSHLAEMIAAANAIFAAFEAWMSDPIWSGARR
jgi:heme oxygenase (biliverdin-IX-beta and delta-forming)